MIEGTPNKLTPAELTFLAEYRKWSNPDPGLFEKVTGAVEGALRAGSGVTAYTKVVEYLASNSDSVDENQIRQMVSKAAADAFDVLQRGAYRTVSADKIRARQAERLGADEFGPKNAKSFDLGDVQGSLEFDRAINITGGVIEGAATGAVGLVGLLADVPALMTMSLRAGLVSATKHGFDISDPLEQAFALQASFSGGFSKDAIEKQDNAKELQTISMEVAEKKAWQEVEELGLRTFVRKTTERFAAGLARRKLIAFMPFVGAAISSGFNAYWMNNVQRDLNFAYGRRFLDEKYSASTIEVAIQTLGRA